jgi:hypothetical protein
VKNTGIQADQMHLQFFNKLPRCPPHGTNLNTDGNPADCYVVLQTLMPQKDVFFLKDVCF